MSPEELDAEIERMESVFRTCFQEYAKAEDYVLRRDLRNAAADAASILAELRLMRSHP